MTKNIAKRFVPSILNPQSSILSRIALLFWLSVVLTLLIKCYLAWLIPMTGDEAEYVGWAQQLSWGYYDHPPLIAWLLYPFTLISLNNICLRFLQIFLSTITACFIFLGLKSEDRTKAYGVALLYLISPLSVLNVAILTDTPLMLFSFFSVYLLFRAEKNHYRYRYYIFAGLCLGAAFLSKYLMFPLAMSIFVYFVLSKNIPRKWTRFFILFLGVLPCLVQNVYWNYYHDWVNFIFNLSARNANEHMTITKPLLYLLSLLYLFTPFVLYYFVKKYRRFYRMMRYSDYSVLALSAIIPIIFFLLLSGVKKIGLHWVFSAYPFLFMIIFPLFEKYEVKKCLVLMFFYTFLQLAAGVILFNLPMSCWQTFSFYPRVNWFLNYSKVVPGLKPYLDQGYILLTPSYSQSYLLSYQIKQPAAVWDTGSVHGRQDDLSTDFKQLSGKNFVIVDVNQKIHPETEVGPYFTRYEIKTIDLNLSIVRLILGYGFNYVKYRDVVLKQIFDQYYQIPKFLPRGALYYKSKYGL